MRWILVIILLIFINSFSYSQVIFRDDFNNENNITSKSNVIITNGKAYVSNISPGSIGYVMSILITKQSNQQWHKLITDYEITNNNPPYPKFTIKVLDKNTNELLSRDNNDDDINNIDLTEIRTNNSIFLAAMFECNISTSTPLFYSWEVTVSEIESSITTRHDDTFYGAPSPLKIDDTSSFIRLYYKNFKKDCSVTLKIYDTNYSLIRNITDKKRYSSGDNLNEKWNGKNGNNIQVMSGVYIAIIKIENTDGTSENPDPFIFAVIR